MNHLELGAVETHIPEDEHRWYRWLKDVENRTGINDLDGDQIEDGYSLDQCYGLWEAGVPSRVASDTILKTKEAL